MTTFRDEILDLVKSAVPAKEPTRDVEISLRYFGWDGQGGCSMQTVGEKYKLTRERVRQVTGKIARHMSTQSDAKLTTLPNLLSMINAMSPARADRIEAALREHGLGDDRLEGVLQADRQFNRPGKHLRVSVEYDTRFVILPDMEGSVTKIIAKTQKLTSHVGFIHLDDLMHLLPGIPKASAYAFIRDVLSLRDDVVWLDADHEWLWLKDAPRNRLITCLHKMLSLFASTTLESVRDGTNRYYRKGDKNPPKITAPAEILKAFIESWGEASVSAAGIVRKTERFSPQVEALDMEKTIALYILNCKGKIAREKELENEMVPEFDGSSHPKKYNFSIALNYSPLIGKGEKRGEYVANGTV